MLRDQIQLWKDGKKDESKFEDLIKLNKVFKRSLIGECNPTDLMRFADFLAVLF